MPVFTLQAPSILPRFELQALQEAVDPPLEPTQVQTQETPDEETTEFVPTEQRLAVGAEAKTSPLEEPQTPLIAATFALQETLFPPPEP